MANDREAQFLLRCLRSVIDGENPSSAELHGLEWARLASLATAHQAEQAVFHVLDRAQLTRRMPTNVRETLLLSYHRTGLKHDWILDQLAPILSALHERGIRVLLLKGVVLATSIYPAPELRPLGDVDLLVPEARFDDLRQVLLTHGYRTDAPELPPAEYPRYSQCYRQIRFVARHPPRLEIHFRLFNLGIPQRDELAWTDACAFRLRGVESAIPSPERFLLHLCLHAEQHGFALLRLLLDLALWQRNAKVCDGTAYEIARRCALRTTVHSALTYTADQLAVDHCPELRRSTQPSRFKRLVRDSILRDREVRRLATPRSLTELELPRSFLLGDASLSDKARFLKAVLLPDRRWIASDAERTAGHGMRLFRAARELFRV